MALSGFFLDAATRDASFVHGSHHHGLVLLSICVSIFSATMALQTAQIARWAERALYYQVAIFTGAIALGGGIWSTHFIGMLAYELPTQVNYSITLTLISLLPACAASWFALRLLAQPDVNRERLLVSGTLVGFGIGAMHYTGMAAMVTPLEMRFEPLAFLLSILVAIVLAVLALWVRYGLQRTSLARVPRLLVSGGVMGLAIASMHYTGMASVRFIGEASLAESDLILSATAASVILSIFTVMVTIMVVAINGLLRSRELYHRMREGSSRLRATLDTAVDGIITINSQGFIQDYNRSAERLFGWTAEEVLGRNIKMLMPEPYQSAHDGYLQNYLTSGQAKIIGIGREVVGLRKNGSHMPMRLAVGRVDLPGELLFVGFVSDISERHALEASLRETAQRAEQAAAAKSTFLANMSHEIRTPMNSIIGFTELLLQTDLTTTQRSHLNTVRQASRNLLRLINDILDTTKMENGQLELEFTDFSLKALAMQIESSLRLSAQAKQLDFSISYPDDMPVYFKGDPLRIVQILNNLVGNAIKFTESGSVDVVFAHEPDMVHIQVRDTGIGMTQQQLELIFAPFAQADASISRRFGGTGLGTTIARQLVEQMGGSIEAESSLGYGSTFHVRLPLSKGERPQELDAEGRHASLPALRFLVADDVPQNLELLDLTLKRNGHEVVRAGDGHEAVERFMAGTFDVVLMDVHMPGVDGLQATRLIRQFERRNARKPTPVIALTASVMDEDRSAARQAGMDGFAIKPLDVPRLFDEVARVLDLSADDVFETPESLDVVPSGENVAIDWERGSSLWGSRARWIEAVGRFLESVEDRHPLPEQKEGVPDSHQTLSSLHGLRGAASNLALPAVAHLAGRMEDRLRAGQHVEECEFQALRSLLAQVRQALKLETAGIDGQEPCEVAAPVPVSELVAAMRNLLAVMRRSELDDALLDTVCLGLDGTGDHVRRRALRSALDNFEFSEASRLLEQLIAEHGNTVSA